jgi:hypothetical protein
VDAVHPEINPIDAQDDALFDTTVDLRAESIGDPVEVELANTVETIRHMLSAIDGEARQGYPRFEYRMSNQFDPSSPPVLVLYDDVTRSTSIVHEAPGEFYVSAHGNVIFTSSVPQQINVSISSTLANTRTTESLPEQIRPTVIPISEVVRARADELGVEELDPTESAVMQLHGHVSMARSASVRKIASKFDNHLCIAIDTMANVNVFRNTDLAGPVGKTNKCMNIDGVGESVTKTQNKAVHPLFGEVWIIPTNSYNILSHHQAMKNGFLMRMSDDNNSCWLVNKDKNLSFLFERDPSDHFLKCLIPNDVVKSKVFN